MKKVIVFEDPCPTPGHSLQDVIDRLIKESKKKKSENK